MSYIKTTLALAATIGAFAGISTSAMGAEFIAKHGTVTTGAFEVKGAAGTAAHQEFSVSSLLVSCAVARAQGTLTVPGDLVSSITFKQCTAGVTIGETKLSVKSVVKGALELEYLPDWEVHPLAPVVIESKPLNCTVELFAGSTGESKYSNEADSTEKLSQFPTGFQQKLETNSVLLMPVHLTGACKSLGEVPGETVQGHYRGGMPYEAVGGDLGFAQEAGELPGGWSRVENERPHEVGEIGEI
ncbi:MAG: hypothetical protein ACLP1Q_13600 [Solirubrobacteraceae bacterium]